MSGERRRGERRRCPVCHRLVQRTVNDSIEAHWDSEFIETCPGMGEPYDITIAGVKGRRRAA